MKTKYKVKLLKWSSLSELEERINQIIENEYKEFYSLKDIKQINLDTYNGYLFILMFYKI